MFCMELKYCRKIWKPENKATMVNIPKAVADYWSDCKKVSIVFNGESLVIRPLAEGAAN